MALSELDAFRRSLSREECEDAWRKMHVAKDQRRQNFADTGYRAAVKRDDKLLAALEAMAETTLAAQEEQYGQTMRASDVFAETRGTTEHQFCREAYRMVNEGTPIREFEWIYGAAAYLCGYNR